MVENKLSIVERLFGKRKTKEDVSTPIEKEEYEKVEPETEQSEEVEQLEDTHPDDSETVKENFIEEPISREDLAKYYGELQKMTPEERRREKKLRINELIEKGMTITQAIMKVDTDEEDGKIAFREMKRQEREEGKIIKPKIPDIEEVEEPESIPEKMFGKRSGFAEKNLKTEPEKRIPKKRSKEPMYRPRLSEFKEEHQSLKDIGRGDMGVKGFFLSPRPLTPGRISDQPDFFGSGLGAGVGLPSTKIPSAGTRPPSTKMPYGKLRPPSVKISERRKISTKFQKPKKSPVKKLMVGKHVSVKVGKPSKIKTNIVKKEDAEAILGLKGFW
jgi:hypothetical protein